MDARLLIWGTFGVTGFVCFLALIVFLTKFHHKRGAKKIGSSSSRKKFLGDSEDVNNKQQESSLRLVLRDFTYEQLYNATNGFSNDKLLKQHDNMYYKGDLVDGECIVIKCFHDKGEAEAEVQVMSNILLSHKRIATPIGICTDSSMFVFKHMPNGDLASSLAGIRQSLHPSSSCSSNESLLDESKSSSSSSDRSAAAAGISKKMKPLDWITRFKIAIGVAEALVFLHHECVPPIIHGDLKSSCVLLDQGYEVRLGGLSSMRIRNDKKDQVEDRTLYHHDIYCFGRIVMDLISGLDCSSGLDALGQAWLEKAMSHERVNHAKFLAMVDVSLVIDEDHVKELMLLASIARSCLAEIPQATQSMANILSMLQNPTIAHLAQEPS